MAANKLKEAVEIFKLNVEAYPQGPTRTTVSPKRT